MFGIYFFCMTSLIFSNFDGYTCLNVSGVVKKFLLGIIFCVVIVSKNKLKETFCALIKP